MARAAGLPLGLEHKPIPLPPGRVVEPFDTRTATCPQCGGPKTVLAKLCATCTDRPFRDLQERVVALWNTGMSAADIADELGVTRALINRVVLSLRRRGDRVPRRG